MIVIINAVINSIYFKKNPLVFSEESLQIKAQPMPMSNNKVYPFSMAQFAELNQILKGTKYTYAVHDNEIYFIKH